MWRSLRVVGICALGGAAVAPVAYVILAGTDTGHIPLSLALLEIGIMGAIGGVVVAAFALGFAKLAELMARC